MPFDEKEMWAETGVRRVPTAQEYGNGFVGGPADPDPVNYMLHRIQEEINDLFGVTNGIYINASITMYVPSQFATIQDAFNYLSGKVIVDPAIVTIEIENGAPEQVITSPLSLNNPYGHRIRLQGQPLQGAFPIDTDFSGNKVTDTAMLRSRFPSRVKAIGCSAFRMVAHQIDRISNILFIGDGTTPVDGIVLGVFANEVGAGQARFESCWAHDWPLFGFRINYASRATGDRVGASYCGLNGIQVTNMSTFQVTSAMRAFRNAGNGFSCLDNSFLEIDGAMSANNGANGISCEVGGTIRGADVISKNNAVNNFVSTNGKMDLVRPVASGPGSGWFNFYALHGAGIRTTGATGIASVSPAVNTVGNVGAFVTS